MTDSDEFIDPGNGPPPEPLGMRGQMLWDSIARVYPLRPDEIRTLCNAAKMADTIDRLEGRLAEDEDLVPGSRPGTFVLHPAFAELRLARQVQSQLLARLALPDLGDEDDDDTMPAKMSRRESASYAARVRHAGRIPR